MRIILDTVTVSELRKGDKMDGAVREWHETGRGRPANLSVITMNEILFGIRKLEGRNDEFAELLLRWYRTLLAQPEIFPLLGVSLRVAEQAADFRALLGLSYNDSFIAATAHAHDLTLATRNISDFEKTGIRLVNPWNFGK
ncbi:MAG: PIN domain-containing protein [Verrucomicrobia bacterium]|jgi:predicted nucleic acid-binding protein|nr:PIN domain-containing protein [Verrucomicrobiota bacterium]|tara:strand:- start:56978 stop:57400 length:423 start_codon:yes stop_codon:yes gene_type:complete